MSSTVERKLAAIMFTDIAGYTAQMSKDENKALEMLRKKRSIIRPLIDNHKGIYVKEIGDGTLSYFESGYNASACAKELQKKLHDEELNIKVGIHIGDIVFDDEDVYGDGVNIASRIESLAPAGGVLISKNVYDELINKDDFDGIALGLQSLKGVGRLVELYAIKDKYLAVPNLEDYKNTEIEVHKDDEVPSIAIIPFSNKGADEDAFYSYGISVDLISDVSGAGLIRVASKKQIDEAGELPQEELAKKLDVRYMANGELWRMGDMFQLSVELYDTKDNKVVWSDRWQEKWDNLPNIKSSLSDGLLKSLDTKPKDEQKVETTNAEAYEFYLKGFHKYKKRENTEDAIIAQELVSKAIELDDQLVKAKAFLALTYTTMGDNDTTIDILEPALRQAQKIGDREGEAAILGAFGQAYCTKGNLELDIFYHKKAVEICNEIGNASGSMSNLSSLGYAYKNTGDLDKALGYLESSLEIAEELDAKRFIKGLLANIADVYQTKGDIDTALKLYKRREAINVAELTKIDTGISLEQDGVSFCHMYEYEKAIKPLDDAASIFEEVFGMAGYVFAVCYAGLASNYMGLYNESLEYFKKSLAGNEKLDDRFGVGICLYGMGYQYYCMGDNDKAIDHLEESYSILKKVGVGNQWLIKSMTALFLVYKSLGREFDKEELNAIVENSQSFEYYINFRLYQLLDDSLYLNNAKSQVEKISDLLDIDMAKKFLGYPIPIAIVEEYNQVFKK